MEGLLAPETRDYTGTPDDQLVVVAYCHYGTILDAFADCVLALYQYDREHGRHWDVLIKNKGPYIAMSRNEIVDGFLKNTFAHWLLFLDNDVTFPMTVFEDLLALADPKEVPILAGLYLTPLNVNPDDPSVTEYLPAWTYDGGYERAPVRSVDFREPLMELHSCGMGCTLIHRSVLEAMRDAHEPQDDGWKWFNHDLLPAGKNGQEVGRCGEDITFCVRARKLGFKIHGTPNVRCGHIKSHHLHPLSYFQARSPTIESSAIGA